MPSDSGRIRTYDRLLRRQLLYPAELLSQVVVPIASNPELPRGSQQLIITSLYSIPFMSNQQSHHTALERFRQVIQPLDLHLWIEPLIKLINDCHLIIDSINSFAVCRSSTLSIAHLSNVSNDFFSLHHNNLFGSTC